MDCVLHNTYVHYIQRYNSSTSLLNEQYLLLVSSNVHLLYICCILGCKYMDVWIMYNMYYIHNIAMYVCIVVALYALNDEL